MNIAMEQTEVRAVPASAQRCQACARKSSQGTPTQEYVNGQLKNKYGDAFIRGNNGARHPLVKHLPVASCNFLGQVVTRLTRSAPAAVQCSTSALSRAEAGLWRPARGRQQGGRVLRSVLSAAGCFTSRRARGEVTCSNVSAVPALSVHRARVCHSAIFWCSRIRLLSVKRLGHVLALQAVLVSVWCTLLEVCSGDTGVAHPYFANPVHAVSRTPLICCCHPRPANSGHATLSLQPTSISGVLHRRLACSRPPAGVAVAGRRGLAEQSTGAADMLFSATLVPRRRHSDSTGRQR